MGIEIGSVAVFDSPVVEMHNRDLLTGRCIDDRIGCAVLLEMVKTLPNLDFCGTVIVSISTMEEIALVGAYQASVHFRPDYFVALDTIPAGGTPDVPESRLPVSIGKGPVLSVADAGRSICHMPNKGLLRTSALHPPRNSCLCRSSACSATAIPTTPTALTVTAATARPCLWPSPDAILIRPSSWSTSTTASPLSICSKPSSCATTA